MKPTLSLTPAMRAAVATLISHLPTQISVAVGANIEETPPYFMEVRLNSSGMTTAKQRIVFESEDQMAQALLVLQQTVAPTSMAKPARVGGFSDLDRELAVMGTTASSVL